MALPKLNYPTYMTEIPSSGKSIKFRPYSSGEEKLLLIAAEGDDVADITEATKNVLASCYTGLNVDELTTYDVDYLFLQLRIKTVGNTSDVYFRHMECDGFGGEPSPNTVTIRINLENVVIAQYDETDGEYKPVDTKAGAKKTIPLSESVGVVMKHPGFAEKAFVQKLIDPTEDDVAKICIVSVYDGETVHTRDDFTPEELEEFWDDLLPSAKDDLLAFVRNVPTVRYESLFKCPDCGHHEPIVLEDLESFFA